MSAKEEERMACSSIEDWRTQTNMAHFLPNFVHGKPCAEILFWETQYYFLVRSLSVASESTAGDHFFLFFFKSSHLRLVLSGTDSQ